MTPTKALIDWLNADPTLLASATGGVWEDPGPADEEERPFVTVRLISGLAEHCGGGSRQLSCLYAVQAVGKAQDITAVRAARDRLEALIGAGAARVLRRHDLAGFEVFGSWPDEAIEFTDPEPVTGIRFEHRGANYRLLVAPVAA
jgi:hypothetical protein